MYPPPFNLTPSYGDTQSHCRGPAGGGTLLRTWRGGVPVPSDATGPWLYCSGTGDVAKGGGVTWRPPAIAVPTLGTLQ